MNNQKPKIFLSYAHEDIGMAKRIYNDLTNSGFNVWFDRESLLPGQVWDLEIENAIESCEYFFVLLSSRSVDQVGYIHKEIRTALDKLDLYPEGKIFIIPIRLDQCQPSHRMINKIQWVDLFPEGEYQKGLEKIKGVISLNISHNFNKKFLNSGLGQQFHSDQNLELEKRSIYFKTYEMFQFPLEFNKLSIQFKYALESGKIFSFIFNLTQNIISKYFHVLFGHSSVRL